MPNAFDWRSQPSSIDLKDLQAGWNVSQSATRSRVKTGYGNANPAFAVHLRGNYVNKYDSDGTLVHQYTSVRAAAKAAGVSHGKMVRTIDQKLELGGYLWRKAT